MANQTGPQQTISAGEEKFELYRKTIGLFLAPALFLLVYFMPFTGLTPAGHALAAIFILTVTLWITEAVPIPIAAVLGPVLTVIFGVTTAKAVFAAFADPTIMLFLGGFILAEAMAVQGLDKRFAIGILSLKAVKGNAYRILFAFGAIITFLSMWLSNTATAAMMYPIGLGVLGAIVKEKAADVGKSKFATGMMLMVAYTASIGGIGTPIGSPPNLIGLASIEKIMKIKIPFLQWMEVTVPIMIVMFIFLYFYISRTSPPPQKDAAGSSEYITREKKALGSWTRGQINALLAFLVAVALWIYPGILAIIEGTKGPNYVHFTTTFPESVVALFAACLLFVLPTNWKKREFTINIKQALNIDWGTLLLFGGGIALGDLMFSTGLAKAIGDGLVSLTGAHTLVSITALAIFIAILLTETTSNTAAATMVVPIVIAIAIQANINPIPPALGATLGASMAFMLPVSTPPNAIVYGSGLVPVTRMIKTGFWLDVFAYFVILIGVLTLPKLVGMM
ncbi:MAG TPA: DASS family sodium-coupled anion symporter [Candidatus Deferrimicrobium sp.]|nr:DASS family sodium-coupled anion symporter [Candidatus Deferrimicrobium sp.]